AGERPARRIALELVAQHRRADDALERRLTDEALRRRRHQHAYGVPLLGGEAGKLKRFVGGDAAGHPEQGAGHEPPSQYGLLLRSTLALTRTCTRTSACPLPSPPGRW